MKRVKRFLTLLFVSALFVCCSVAAAFIGSAESADPARSDISSVTAMNEGEETALKAGTKYVGNKAIVYGDTVVFGYKNADSAKQLRMAFGIGSYGFYLYYNPGNPVTVMSCDMSAWARKSNIVTISRDLFDEYNEIELCLTEKDEQNVRLEMRYTDGEERKTIGCDFVKAESSDGLLRYGDMNFDGNKVKSLLPAPVFGNGFLYSGENVTGENQYGGCSLAAVSREKAEAAGVPEGFESDCVLIASSDKASFDMSFDFTALSYKRKHITEISVRLYIEKNAADTDGYPEIRIPGKNGSWILRSAVGVGKTGQWIAISFSSDVIDALCPEGILGKFVFCVRSNGQAKMFIDEIAVETLPRDGVAPVINAAITSFKTTEGTYPTLDYITVTDDSGTFDVTYEWSDGALDFNGRLKAGNHTCTINATDGWDNTATVVIRYDVEKETPVERYSVTFRCDGAEDRIIEYSAETTDYVIAPDIPVKRFYRAAWEEYSLEFTSGQVVNAEYTPISYTIDYYADGEKTETKTYSISDGDYADPAVPQKKGYTAKWEEYRFEDVETISVHAVYTPIEYTVTFEADGKTVAAVTYNYDNKNIVEPAVPEKRYYEGAWEEYALEGDVTVTAVYTPVIYTVTYMADGKKAGEVKYSVEDYDFDEPAVPKKDGYTGKWEDHEFLFENITVNAVYAKSETPAEPDSSDADGGDKKRGCSSSVEKIAPILTVAIAVAGAFVFKRRKDL